jgi:antitoxin ParD1/3/4
MRTTRELSNIVAGKCDNARAVHEQDAAIERWLHEEVMAGHAEYMTDPSKGASADTILNRIKARRTGGRR